MQADLCDAAAGALDSQRSHGKHSSVSRVETTLNFACFSGEKMKIPVQSGAISPRQDSAHASRIQKSLTCWSCGIDRDTLCDNFQSRPKSLRCINVKGAFPD
jgi:hypothetical protein